MASRLASPDRNLPRPGRRSAGAPAPRRAWRGGAAALALALAVIAPPARAQSANADEAREAFREGISYEQAGDWGRALKRFRDAAAFRSTPQIRFHIARCLEQLGNWTEAIGAYELAVADATGAQRKEIAKHARPAVEALRKKVPKLILQRAPGAEFVTVHLNDAEVGAASFGQPLALNPGGHVLRVSEAGLSEEQNVVLTEGETRTVVVQPPKVPAGPAPAPPARAAKPAPPPPERAARPTWLPWTLLGVGAASLAATGVFVALRQQRVNDINDECGPDGQPCPSSVRPIYDDGRRFTLLANVTGAVGVAALGAGVVVLLLQRPAGDKPPPRPAAVEAAVSPGFVGVRGRF
jgi:hypothetical protein